MKHSTFSREQAVCLMLVIMSLQALFLSIQARGYAGDILWQKAVAIADANRHRTPESAVLRIEILDKRGRVEQVEEMPVEFSSVDSATLNIVGNIPFDPEFQDEISARPTSEVRDIEGEKCIKYMYVWTRPDGVQKGTAWLAQETGIPAKIEFSSDAGSWFSRTQHVTVIFRNRSCDAWYPSKMIVEIGAGLLTLGRSFRIVLDYEISQQTR